VVGCSHECVKELRVGRHGLLEEAVVAAEQMQLAAVVVVVVVVDCSGGPGTGLLAAAVAPLVLQLFLVPPLMRMHFYRGKLVHPGL